MALYIEVDKTINTISVAPTGVQGIQGEGVIAGGAENQVLVKNSSTDYDTKWITLTALESTVIIEW